MTDADRANDDDELLDSLVVRSLDALERGDGAAVASIEAEHPALAERLRERLQWLGHRGLLTPDIDADIPESFGGYEIVEEVGRGGMGEVYRAQQSLPVRREVALKVLKLGMDSREIVARFEAERQVLARLSHENVARIYDAGITPAGRPFFAMEFVDGEPITGFCDARRYATEQRLQLFATVCDAVQHAHQNGVIHRDLKPSNVLVTGRNGEPIAKIIDFGVAKSVGADAPEEGLRTEHGQMLGTPEYMSPEQANGEIVDTRTDVFSLGVVLYELLTGLLPFDSGELRKGGFADLRRILADETPATPSTRITSLGIDAREIAERRGIELGGLRRRLRGDLDRITMTAMAKERDERYPSPSELATDVRRFLAFEPIVAAPPGLRYRFGKFARRHRVAVTAGALLLAALLAGGIGTTWGLIRANRSLALAKSAVRGLLTRVATADLRDVPRTDELRRDLFADALEFHRKFLAEAPNDPETIVSTAKVAFNLACFHSGLGEYEAARARFAEAENLFARLADTGHVEARLRLGKTLARQLVVHAHKEEERAGEDAFTRAKAILEALERERPDDPECKKALAFLYNCHGAFLERLGKAGGDAADKELEYSEQITALRPDSFAETRALCMAEHNRALELMREGDFAKAELLLEKPIRRLEEVPESWREKRGRRFVLAVATSTLAELHLVTEDRRTAARLAQRALGIHDQLLDDSPSEVLYMLHYATAVSCLARTGTLPKGEADRLLRRARRRLQRAVRFSPADKRCRDTLRHIESLLER